MNQGWKKVYTGFSLAVSLLCFVLLLFSGIPARENKIKAEQPGQEQIAQADDAKKPLEAAESVKLGAEGKEKEADSKDGQEDTGKENAGKENAGQDAAGKGTTAQAKRVVLDAGHGGKDAGAEGTLVSLYPKENESDAAGGVEKLLEKELSLQIAQLIGKELARQDKKVSYTRTGDFTTDLDSRKETAQKDETLLLISIHAGTDGNSLTHGIEIFANKQAEELLCGEKTLCETLSETLTAATGEDVRIGSMQTEQGNLLYEVSVPAVQINVGFLTNAQDCKLLSKESYQKRLADGICRGLEELIK